MRRIAQFDRMTDEDRGAVVAIGNFDGVHKGHQAVIATARSIALETGRPTAVLTFEPHPRVFFRPNDPPFRLMRAKGRARHLGYWGVELLYEMPFDAAIASLSAEAFVSDILGTTLNAAHVVVGGDFQFGSGRQGAAEDLVRLAQAAGMGGTIAPMLEIGPEDVSSTRIRQALSEGRPRDAAAMLGHWHFLDGVVLHGEKRGRELGYPTANIAIDGVHPPRFGVYATMVHTEDTPGRRGLPAVTSIGIRPMFDGDTPNCESFIFDFDADLYGQEIEVRLIEYLRPEMKFDSLEALIAQMDDDSAAARRITADV